MLSAAFWLTLLAASLTSAAPLQPTFSTCENYYNAAPGINRLNITNIYANFVPGSRARQLSLPGDGQDVLRVDLIGNVGAEIVGYDNGTNKLATLFTDTTVGGISVYRSTSWVCNSLFPPTLPTPYYPFNTTYCPLPAGPFGLNLSIPLWRSFALTTLTTQVRIVDTSLAANTLSCVNISFTPYDRDGWYYDLFLWLPVTLAIGFWVTSWGARFAAGWVVGSGVAEYGTQRKAEAKEAVMRKWGTMIVSGVSGERLTVSSGLLRFVTPGLRDIMHHIQFCTILAMVAVSWPHFVYPIAARLAWADLAWNSTIIPGAVSAYPTNTTLPAAFSNQMSTELYPLYLDTGYNPLLNLNSRPGLESFAAAIGLRAQDLFGTCLAIFCLIAAAIIVLSIAIWVIHALTEAYTQPRASAPAKRLSYGSSLALSVAGEKPDSKSAPPTPGWEREHDQLPITTSQSQLNLNRKGPGPLRRAWLRFRPKGEAGAFHAAALYGNLLRLILVFHLPITTFSVYQLVHPASIVSRVFAAIALVFLSILIPAGIMWKVHKTPGGKLYDATRTLLAMSTMYNHYVVDKQLFRIFPLSVSLITGIAVGAGQGSGIAQAVVIVVLELAMLILPAVWYPWGDGASMGAPSVFLSVIRVASALLVMLLSPSFQMTESTQIWLAYAVLFLNAMAFIFFLFMLLTKLFEGLVRLFGGVHFDESTHPLDGGIFAAIADLDCLNGVMGGKAAARKRRKRGSRQLQRNVSAAGSLTTQQMLDKHSQMVPRQSPDTPAWGAYPGNEAYFNQPPLGPPPMERHSSDSRYEETGGNIMDAWRTRSNEGYRPVVYAPTPSEPGPMFPGLGDRVANPYDVQAARRASNTSMGATEFGRSRSPPVIRVSHATMPVRPQHQREYSSKAMIDSYDSESGKGGYSTYPSTSAVDVGHKRHSGTLDPPTHVPLKPADLTLPKRRSLNDLKHDADSAGSEFSGDDGPSGKKGKKSKRQWFSRAPDTGEETEESDDEPGPSRRRSSAVRTVPVGTPLVAESKGRSWKRRVGLGGFRRKSMNDEEERARDENKARKDALAAESGALFAGVDSPRKQTAAGKQRATENPKGFVIHRRNQGSSSTLPSAQPGAQPAPRTAAAIPLLPLAPRSVTPAAQADSEPGPSFRVKRVGQAQARPHPVVPAINPSSTSVSPNVAPAALAKVQYPPAPVPQKSFRVIRHTPTSSTNPPAADTNDTPSRSFVVKRLASGSSTPPVSPPRNQADLGYSLDSFRPYTPPALTPSSPPSSWSRGNDNVWPSRTSLERQTSPERPLKSPRRASQESAR